MPISPAMYAPEDDPSLPPQAANDDASGSDIQVQIGDEFDPGEDPQQAGPQPQFKDNLCEYLEEQDMQKISTDLLNAFDDDESSRSQWLKEYVDGLDYLGFSQEDRTYPFNGASGVFHPVMTEAVVRFQSNAIMEIFPAVGPVLVKVMGEETPQKMQQSIRIKEEMNWQLTENMPEFRSETEQLLFRLPLAGSVFKKTYFDTLTQKPCSYMVPAEDLVVDYGASHIDSAERICQIQRFSKNKLLKMMRAGLYRKVKLGTPVPYTSDGKEKEDELKGIEKTGSRAQDERYTVLEFHVHYNLPGPFEDEDDIADPYIITIDKSSQTVLGIYRNWDEKDETRKPDTYFTHYFYMPGLGFYGIGLIHLMGSITKASTSILRQLIDAGTLSNLPGGLKTRGLRVKGGEDPIAPGEWRDVDVPAGALKDNIMPLPYKEPSSVLAALLQNLIDEGRRIGSIADVDIGSGNADAPVGTTLALMERSLKVMSAVHARLHASLKKELKLIAKTIADYMGPRYAWDDSGKFNRQQDFDDRVDVIPVSDPNAATQAQRIVQMQAVMQLAQTAPELYNMKELHRAGLQAIGIKNDDKILPYDNPPPLMDPVQENGAILTQQPVKVYPEQDHQAHITSHMSAMTDPSIAEMVGQSPNAQKISSAMESHIADHLAQQYRQEIQQQMGVELPPSGQPMDPEIENRISRLVAIAAVRLKKQHEAVAAQQQAQQIATDPVFQLRVKEVQIKEDTLKHQMRKDATDDMIEVQKEAAKLAMEEKRIESQEVQTGMKIGADLMTFGATLTAEERKQATPLGMEAVQTIRTELHEQNLQANEHAMKQKQMDHEATQNALDRNNALQIAKAKGKPKPAAK
jgi:hypothetical protein